ncbi:hypothetical protein Tco_0233284 [Tanacetum coccineum]
MRWKARSMLLMYGWHSYEHILTFNQYKDAKTLFAAIQTRFGGNEATKKTQKTLLKQMYENFSASSTESLDSIFNRLQNIVSQLAILSENISQEDLNLKFLRSLPSEWNTHVVVWRNKLDLDTMSFDDLYNNFKIIEQEVKELQVKHHAQFCRAWAFVQSNQVSTCICGLEQIHEDDYRRDGFEVAVVVSIVEMRGPRNQDSRNKNQDNSRRTVNVEETSSKAMVAIDGARLLRIEFNKSEFNLATYKRGLASVEEQLVFYKKNEVIFYEQLAVLKRDISYKDSEISMLKSELEKLKQENESNQLKIEKFENASMSLDKLIGRLFSPPKFDLSNSGLEEFQQPEFKGYGPKTSKSVSEDISNEVRETSDAPLVKELESNDNLEKKTISPTSPRGNQRNWNHQKSQQLGSNFVMYNKACFVYGSFDHVQAHCNYHQRERVVFGNNYTRVNYNYFAKKAYPSAHRNMVPRAVLMKTGLRSLNTARPVNTAHPKTIVYSARPMPKAVNTARLNSAVFNAVRENHVNAIMASTCWVWRPTKLNSVSITLKEHNYGHPQKEDQGYVDSGCSRNMTGNMSYLSDFKEFDGGYVTFGGGAKGGKITSKGTLKTSKLDFEDVYFVKEL